MRLYEPRQINLGPPAAASRTMAIVLFAAIPAQNEKTTLYRYCRIDTGAALN